MLSKVDFLKKKTAELQAQLEVEMAKNTNVSDGTLPVRIGKKKPYCNEQPPRLLKSPSKAIGNINEIKRPTIIGNIEEIKENKVIKRPKVIGKIKKIKAK